ncbi:MAG: permease [Pseudomonadota bacterium]
MTWLLETCNSIVAMTWNVAWALCLGFLLSATFQTLVPSRLVRDKLGNTNARSLAVATFLGAVSSSCSYAAASMSKSLFQKGASLPVSSAFLVSSTNLVLEIVLVIWILMGWQFVVGELMGGLILVLLISLLMPVFISNRQVQTMWRHIQRQERSAIAEAACGDMHEGGCGNDREGSCGAQLAGQDKAATTLAICRRFRMEVSMVGKDLAIGILTAAILAATVPEPWWSTVFMTPEDASHPGWGVLIWNAIIGPFIAIAAFVCSVGNIVLASVLWTGGISFGGVMAFILADIITIPMIRVYATYYGWPAALRYGAVLFFYIFLTALLLDALFLSTGLLPQGPRASHIMTMGIELNYTSLLNAIFVPTAVGVWIMGRPEA